MTRRNRIISIIRELRSADDMLEPTRYFGTGWDGDDCVTFLETGVAGDGGAGY